MDEADLPLLDHNMATANQAYLGTSEHGDTAEDRHAWLWCCGLPAPDFNVVFPKTPAKDLDRCLDRARAYFESRTLPWRLMLREPDLSAQAPRLEASGFRESGRSPGMVLDVLPAPFPKPPPGLVLRDVTSKAELDAFASTAFLGFGLPAELGPKFVTRGFAARPGGRLCVGWVGDEPVCTAATVVTGDWAGIYWVATLEAHRGKGYGEAATWAAIDAGRQLGGRRACLQASEIGRPVYERMGFRTVTEYLKLAPPQASTPA